MAEMNCPQLLDRPVVVCDRAIEVAFAEKGVGAVMECDRQVVGRFSAKPDDSRAPADRQVEREHVTGVRAPNPVLGKLRGWREHRRRSKQHADDGADHVARDEAAGLRSDILRRPRCMSGSLSRPEAARTAGKPPNGRIRGLVLTQRPKITEPPREAVRHACHALSRSDLQRPS